MNNPDLSPSNGWFADYLPWVIIGALLLGVALSLGTAVIAKRLLIPTFEDRFQECMATADAAGVVDVASDEVKMLCLRHASN